MKEGKRPFSILRRSAGEVKRYRIYRRIIPRLAGLLLLLLVIVYIISLLVAQRGSFTVSIRDYNDKRYALALSENESFRQFSSKLDAKAAKDITNIDGNTLPDNLNDVSGEHNGDNYVAYTFYLKNTGELTCSYLYRLSITKMTFGIDEAIRVRIYYTPFYYKAAEDAYDYSGNYTDYAKPKTGGNGAPEIDPENRVNTNFLDANTVTEGRVENFGVGDISKITVVIWLEGNDPDCTDDRLGGEFRVDMTMQVIDYTAAN